MNPQKNRRIPAWWNYAETIVADYKANKAELSTRRDAIILKKGVNKLPDLPRTDVTGERAVIVTTDRRIQHLTDCVTAVEYAIKEFQRVEKDATVLAIRMRIIDHLYWKGHDSIYRARYHIRNIAQECHISERLAQSYRHQFLTLVAFSMGWMDVDTQNNRRRAAAPC